MASHHTDRVGDTAVQEAMGQVEMGEEGWGRRRGRGGEEERQEGAGNRGGGGKGGEREGAEAEAKAEGHVLKKGG